MGIRQILNGKRYKIDLTLNDAQFMDIVERILNQLGPDIKVLENKNISPFTNQVMKRVANIKARVRVTL